MQISSLDDFACGNTGIDNFLKRGDGLRFQVDRHKMDTMVMATETKVLGYMAYSLKEVTAYSNNSNASGLNNLTKSILDGLISTIQ